MANSTDICLQTAKTLIGEIDPFIVSLKKEERKRMKGLNRLMYHACGYIVTTTVT